MMSIGIAVAIRMIVVETVVIEWMPVFTRARIPVIVRPSVEKWIIPPVPDPAWTIRGSESSP